MSSVLRSHQSVNPPPSAADAVAALLAEPIARRAAELVIERISELPRQCEQRVEDSDEICARFKISRPTLRAEISRGLPYILVGTCKRFVVEDVLAWYRRQRQPEITEAESLEFQREAEDVLG
jgi:hypothetical protein